MARLLCVAVLLPLAIAASQSADAGDYVKKGHRRNICWPRPYIYQDRAAAAAPWAVMANNGWRRQNLLGTHHFNADSSKLTTAGELKIQWILTQAPPQRRVVVVSKSLNAETDALRIEAVQIAASRLLPIGVTADIQQTHLVTEGRSAESIDTINVRFRENAPMPILPAVSEGSEE